MEQIKKQFPTFKLIELKQNVRFTEGIRNFICDAFPTIQILGENKSKGIKPQILYFDSEEEEIKGIQEHLRKEKQTKSIGIFLQKNSDVVKMFLHLKEKEFDNVGYKAQIDNRSIENLCISDNSINILTYHSAKGLEFGSIYLPFLNTSEISPNLFYVGLTRARQKIVLSYSKGFTCSLKFSNPSVYEGVIKRPYLIEEVQLEFKEFYFVIEEIKKQHNEYGLSDGKKEINKEKENFRAKIPQLKEKLKDAGLTSIAIEGFFKTIFF